MYTFLFSDIADSTALWQKFPREMSEALAVHDSIFRKTIPSNTGEIVKSTGDGFHAVFESPGAAVDAAIELQKYIIRQDWGDTGPLRVRMGIHTGEAEPRAGDYYGTTVNKAARVMSLANGDQILLSDTSVTLLNDIAREDFHFQALGKFRLKGLAGQTVIHQLEHPDLPVKFPPLKGGTRTPSNLPAELTSFIGREAQIEGILNLLVDTEANENRARLLTLTGPGGTGKSRLSIQAARSCREAFPDGVWLFEMAAITNPDLLPKALMDIFGLQDNAGGDPTATLANYFRNQQSLLIFDNCEHLLDASANLILPIINAAPMVQVIASSREALGIPGEHVLAIPSLTMPSETDDWDVIQSCEAVQLFSTRVREAGAGQWLIPENGPYIAKICRRLDGIPLAIELAAARMRVFSPAQILERLDDRFRLLTGGSRTALPRLQTLKALIDWSYDLLSEDEKGLFQELSVFHGGWTIEMAEEICSDWDALALLPQLVDKSLVIATPTQGVMRYSFLETIRQYARDLLMASGKSPALRNGHVAFFERFTETDFNWDIIENFLFIKSLSPEIENIRAALTWGLNQDPMTALDIALNLTNYWGDAGLVKEGLDWITRLGEALAIEEKTPKNELETKRLARFFLGRSAMLARLGHYTQSFADAKKGETVARTNDDFNLIVLSLTLKTLPGLNLGKFEEVVIAVEEGLRKTTEKKRDLWKGIFMLGNSMLKMVVERDAKASRRWIEEAFDLVPELRQSTLGMRPLVNLEMQEQNWERARELVLGELQKFDEMKLENKSRYYSLQHANLGHIERKAGNLDAALRIYASALPVYIELSMEPVAIRLIECFGMIAVQKGQHVRAARLFGAAERQRERIQVNMRGDEKYEYAAHMTQLKEQLAEKELDMEWHRGKILAFEQVVETALNFGATLKL